MPRKQHNILNINTDYSDWYVYGARFYDPQIGRWTITDPLAESNYNWTPYRYGFDNPMNFSDMTGMLESTHTDEEVT